MLITNHHMLDTNIVLAMILPSDSSYEEAKSYFEKNYTRYISETCFKEAKRKLINDKKIYLNISEFTKNYSLDNSINYNKLEQCKLHVEKLFVNQYAGSQFEYLLPEDRFKKIVHKFFNEFHFEINNVLLANNNDELNNIIKKASTKILLNLNGFSSGC